MLENVVAELRRVEAELRRTKQEAEAARVEVSRRDDFERYIARYFAARSECYLAGAAGTYGQYITSAAELTERLAGFGGGRRCRSGVAICVPARMEENYLQEFVAVHLLQGVEHIFVFASSTSRSAEHSATTAAHSIRGDGRRRWEDDQKQRDRLAPFIDAGLISMIPWNGTEQGSYDTCLRMQRDHRTGRNRYRWLAFINADEMILLKRPPYCLADFLDQYEDYGGLAVQWRLFGSSGYQTSQAHRLVTETYTRVMPTNPHIKSIANTAHTVAVRHPHYPVFEQGYYAVDAARRRVDGPFGHAEAPDVYDLVQLNHYSLKSFEEYLRKNSRGYIDGALPKSLFAFWIHDISSDADAGPFPLLAELRFLLGLSSTNLTGPIMRLRLRNTM